MLFVNMPVADLERSKGFSVSSRDEVDAVSAAALEAGGTEADDAEAAA
jgi:predicted lactoylglutathione lyase